MKVVIWSGQHQAYWRPKGSVVGGVMVTDQELWQNILNITEAYEKSRSMQKLDKYVVTAQPEIVYEAWKY